MAKESGVIDAEYSETKAVAVIERPSTLPMARDLTAPGAIEHALQQTGAMIEYKDRVIELCVKKARPSDIIGMGKGRDAAPYFAEAFCEQLLARIGGGEIRILSKDYEDHGEGHYGYTVTVRIDIPGLGATEGLGMATTRDQFLGCVPAKKWNDKTRKKEPVYDSAGQPVMTRQADEVSRHNLLQHARTRAVGSALRKMLGLSGYTWDDLEAMGFSREGSSNVAYDKKQKPKSDAPAALVAQLRSFDKNKIFSWNQIGKIASEIGLPDSRALDLSKDDMQKLVNELNKRADEMEK
ncbi:MAG: hypothetical protein KAY24_01075 [Candidatus Eisenbacteria sp.]|nr:hypothetical protein [Candidatus Eisenbacteria bacterium]